MHSITDRQTDRQTDGQQAAGNSRSYCVAVRSAKKHFSIITAKNDITAAANEAMSNFADMLQMWKTHLCKRILRAKR